MVLEYLQGQPLNRLLKASPRLSPTRAVALRVPVLRALACAHEQKVVHRDLTPENILVTDSGTLKVLDFGIAKVLRSEQQQTAPTSPSAVKAELQAYSAAGTDPGTINLTRHGALLGTMS